MKDEELKKLFAAMKLQEPAPEQVNRWQRFMNTEIAQRSRKTIRQMWWQWLIAGSIGFASATMYLKNPTRYSAHNLTNNPAQEMYSETATSEYIYDK